MTRAVNAFFVSSATLILRAAVAVVGINARPVNTLLRRETPNPARPAVIDVALEIGAFTVTTVGAIGATRGHAAGAPFRQPIIGEARLTLANAFAI